MVRLLKMRLTEYFKTRKKPVTFYSLHGFASVNYIQVISQYLLSQGHNKVLRNIYRGECADLSRGLGMKSPSIALLTSDICGFLVAQFVSHIAHQR